MPQLQLPVFADGLTSITEDLAFQREDGKVVYFHGLLPVFQHGEKDLRSFRMFTSQLIANGTEVTGNGGAGYLLAPNAKVCIIGGKVSGNREGGIVQAPP